MITFSIKDVTAVGNATVLENGDTIQKCLVQVMINGIISDNKTVTDVVDFTVPNSVMVGSPTPIITAWEYIKNVLAPQWVLDNYSEI